MCVYSWRGKIKWKNNTAEEPFCHLHLAQHLISLGWGTSCVNCANFVAAAASHFLLLQGADKYATHTHTQTHTQRTQTHLVWHLILSACWGILLCSEKQINKQCRQQTQRGKDSARRARGATRCSNYKVARETFYDLSTWRQQTRNRQQIAVCFMASNNQGVPGCAGRKSIPWRSMGSREPGEPANQRLRDSGWCISELYLSQLPFVKLQIGTDWRGKANWKYSLN